MLKIVMDTNLFVSGIISPYGTPAKLLTRWQAREFQLVSCPQMVDELDKVLQRPKLALKYHIAAQDRENLINELRHLAIFVAGDTITGVVDDPKDDMLVACAVEGNAKYLLTGDDDLLRLGRYQKSRIIIATQFLHILERCKRRFVLHD